MSRYGSYSDDYYINMNLNTEMDLSQNRETVLHFFEQIQRQYPTMKNFYGRERGEFVLEEDKDRGAYRWASLEGRRVSSGQVNPATVEETLQQHALVTPKTVKATSRAGWPKVNRASLCSRNSAAIHPNSLGKAATVARESAADTGSF